MHEPWPLYSIRRGPDIRAGSWQQRLRSRSMKGRFSVGRRESVRVEEERGGKQGWCSGPRRGFSERVSRGRPVRGLRIPKEHGFTSFNAKGQRQWVVGQPHELFATGRAGRRSKLGAEGGSRRGFLSAKRVGGSEYMLVDSASQSDVNVSR